jgi:hypothetical protein
VCRYLLFFSDRERCDEAYPPVRNHIERISNDLVLVVHSKREVIEGVRMPVDCYVSKSSERIEVDSRVLILIVNSVRTGLKCSRKVKTTKP